MVGRLISDVEEAIADVGCKIIKSDDYMLPTPKQNILYGSLVFDSYNRDKDVVVVDECGDALFITRNEENYYKNISKITGIIRGNV